MLSEKEKEKIYEKVLPKGIRTDFSYQVYEAFKKDRITEAEFYNAIGLHRTEATSDVIIERLEHLPDELRPL